VTPEELEQIAIETRDKRKNLVRELHGGRLFVAPQ